MSSFLNIKEQKSQDAGASWLKTEDNLHYSITSAHLCPMSIMITQLINIAGIKSGVRLYFSILIIFINDDLLSHMVNHLRG